MAENLVEKASRESEKSCQLAILSTPSAYHAFITLIPQSKRVGGTREKPIYAKIRLPYMTVDGRVTMAMDEHREKGARLTIDTIYETISAESGDKTVCRAIVNSSLLGSAVGHSVVGFGGSGVDSTNPLENAETSAIGRALGFLGYGVFGHGIASAEEVLAAMSVNTEGNTTPEETTPLGAEETPSPAAEDTPSPASQKQLGFLYSLLKKYGVADGDKRALIQFVHGDNVSKETANLLINEMDGTEQLPGVLKKSYVKMLVRDLGKDRNVVAQHMDDTFGHHNPSLLNQEEFGTLVAYLRAETPVAFDPDDIYSPGELPAPTHDQWMKFVTDTCMKGRLTAVEFQKWALAQWGNGTVEDMTQLPSEVYHTLKGMDIKQIADEVRSFHAEPQEQVALVG